MPSRRTSRATKSLLLVGLLLVDTAAVAAQQAPTALRLLELADYYEMVRTGDIEASLDGRRVVFSRTRMDRVADASVTSLWEMSPSGSGLRRLVEPGSHPRLSPDGSWLAYLQDSQVWLLPLNGGAPWRLTDLAEGVTDFAWSPDSDRIVLVSQESRAPGPTALPMPGAVAEPTATAKLLAPDPPALAERRTLPWVVMRLQSRPHGIGYLSARRYHLFVADVPDHAAAPLPVRRLTEGPQDGASPTWSADGRWIAFVSNRSEESAVGNKSEIWLVSPEGGQPIRVTNSSGTEAVPAWSPDSRFLAYRYTPDDPPLYANSRLRMIGLYPPQGEDDDGSAPAELQIGEPQELTAEIDRPIASAPAWSSDRATIYVTIQDRGTVPLLQVSTGLTRLGERRRGFLGIGRRRAAPAVPAGTAGAIIAGPRVVGAFTLIGDGSRVLAELSWGTEPAEIYAVATDAQRTAVPLRDPNAHMRPTALPPAVDLVQLTELNQRWRRTMRLAEPEPLRFSSGEETVIEGWLMRPLDAAEGARHALIVRLHGGPMDQFTWAFSWERQWLVAQGYAVLFLNPRGSSGYGQAFAHSLWTEWGGADLDDVLAGVDHLQQREAIDPERIGVGGSSYGGILTNYLIAKSGRFAAAISGASEPDNFAYYGTDELRRWFERELGLPYEPAVRGIYELLAPILAVDDIVTPTMFMLGENDWRAPASLSEGMFARLRRRMLDGGPDTGLIIYPDDADPVGKPSFVIDRWRRYKAWFDRHLLGDDTADPFFGAGAW